ncbi:MAG: dodecin family protein [Myxococcota bacterium]
MSVARVTEITAQSDKGFEDAIQQGIARANKTIENIQSAWVKDQKLAIEGGKIVGWRVDMKVTFILKE